MLWQIILRSTPLTIAFSNKGIVVFWGMLWGLLFFGENINLVKVIAAVLVITGIIVVGKADE
jgi:multidrug transporter EmrE-like cation transporter